MELDQQLLVVKLLHLRDQTLDHLERFGKVALPHEERGEASLDPLAEKGPLALLAPRYRVAAERDQRVRQRDETVLVLVKALVHLCDEVPNVLGRPCLGNGGEKGLELGEVENARERRRILVQSVQLAEGV